MVKLLVSLFILASCTANTQEIITCEDVLHPALSSVSFNELESASVDNWITSHFPGAVTIHNGAGSYAWGSGGKDFNAFFDHTSRYLAQFPGGRLNISPKSTEPLPTIADVLRCFGKPDLYALQDIPAEVPEVGFSMWYLHRGLIFQTVESKGLIPRKFDLTSRLRGPFLAVPPGSPEQMAASWWTADPDYIARLMADMKPWPENFQGTE
ncbi:MAG: hypothetical protein U0X20_07470 [Caldilineaceae bacterium]